MNWPWCDWPTLDTVYLSKFNIFPLSVTIIQSRWAIDSFFFCVTAATDLILLYIKMNSMSSMLCGIQSLHFGKDSMVSLQAPWVEASESISGISGIDLRNKGRLEKLADLGWHWKRVATLVKFPFFTEGVFVAHVGWWCCLVRQIFCPFWGTENVWERIRLEMMCVFEMPSCLKWIEASVSCIK